MVDKHARRVLLLRCCVAASVGAHRRGSDSEHRRVNSTYAIRSSEGRGLLFTNLTPGEQIETYRSMKFKVC